MIDLNKLEVTTEEIEAGARVFYESYPMRSDYGYYMKWDDLKPFQKHRYTTMARRIIRAAKGTQVVIEDEAA